jgi:hypothetical protein
MVDKFKAVVMEKLPMILETCLRDLIGEFLKREEETPSKQVTEPK